MHLAREAGFLVSSVSGSSLPSGPGPLSQPETRVAAPTHAAFPDAAPLVRFEDVDKTYDGEQLVVKSLNLDIRRGEFLTLLGPSGSGKTTSLMMLAGFETPTDGEIYVDGRPIKNVPPHRRNIGMVFQNYALFPQYNLITHSQGVCVY